MNGRLLAPAAATTPGSAARTKNPCDQRRGTTVGAESGATAEGRSTQLCLEA